MTRRYYSARTGKNPSASLLDLPMLLRVFGDLYQTLSDKAYFQEAFGYDCVDSGFVPGILGYDIEAQMLRRLRKPNIWPIYEKHSDYSEDDLFDVIEFLSDYIAKPNKGTYHDFANCGWHYHTFDREAGREEYRIEINELLSDYGEGFELSVLIR